MSTILLAIVSLFYLIIGINQLALHHFGFAFMWFGYFIANVGLYFAGATQ